MSYLTKRPSQLFDRFFSEYTTNSKGLDIYKENNSYTLEMDLPGFNKEDIHINYQDEVLTLEATKEEVNEEREYFYRNRHVENIKRSFRFSDVDRDHIQADYVDGVLKITLPILVPEEKRPRQIEIK